MIKIAYLDLDSVAYLGACIAQKKGYKWVNKETSEETEVFKSAKDAKVWMEGEIAFAETDPDEWKRETVEFLLSEEEAIKFTERELKSWVSTAKSLTKNPDIKVKGFLTSSGKKNKDINGLEDRYQFNRYKDTENWIPIDKPKHLKACREYLLRCYDWIKLSPVGFEADALVIYFAEKHGPNTVIMSKDKDLVQAMNTNFIDMNKIPKFRKLIKLDEVGNVELVDTNSGPDIKGNGFKFLCCQIIRGDRSDGYLGLKGIGPVAAFEIINTCETIEDCCKALVSLYEERFPNGYEYTSWDNKPQQRTAHELLKQHCQLAYQERGKSDKTNPISRYLAGKDPIRRY